MQITVTSKLRQAVKREIVRQIDQGVSAKLARLHSAVPMDRTTVYRLLKRVQREGESAFTDGRHGHPVKLRGEILTFLLDYCQSYRRRRIIGSSWFLVKRWEKSLASSAPVKRVLDR